MANGQRTAVRGALIQSSFKQRQTKLVPTAPSQNRVVGPHINQHSAYLKRSAQAKMDQLRAAPKPAAVQVPRVTPRAPVVQRPAAHKSAVQPKFKNSIQPSRPANVVQRACILNGLAACWNSIFGSRRENYQQIQDDSSSSSSVGLGTPVTSYQKPKDVLVDETFTVPNISYGSSVLSTLITNCALVIYCYDDDFDCYHPSGGNFYSSHKARPNPNRIFYVYMARHDRSAKEIADYKRYAEQYRQAVGSPPLIVRGHLGGQTDIYVKVISDNNIQPVGGSLLVQ